MNKTITNLHLPFWANRRITDSRKQEAEVQGYSSVHTIRLGCLLGREVSGETVWPSGEGPLGVRHNGCCGMCRPVSSLLFYSSQVDGWMDGLND